LTWTLTVRYQALEPLLSQLVLPKLVIFFFANEENVTNYVMEYTNPLLGLTSSRIATAPSPDAAEPPVPMPAESSIPSQASQGKIPNSSTPMQPGTLGGASATSDSTQALRVEGNISKFSVSITGNGGAKKAQKMRPSKSSTAR
jgi:hypothetical protein